ncbi:hypothetical protein QEN19_002594 [Hanseniaspora menglaensis]
MSLIKTELRKNYLRSVTNHSDKALIALQSAIVTEKILHVIKSNYALKNIAVYMAQDQELDTTNLIKELFSLGNKNIFLPICTNTHITNQDNVLIFPAEHKPKASPRQHHLIFKQVQTFNEVEALKPTGRFKIREPSIDNKADDTNNVTIPHSKLDLVIVPAVILDEITKMRIGYGKGYYDDFIKRFLYNSWKPYHDGSPMKTLLTIELFKLWKESEFKQSCFLAHKEDVNKQIESYLKLKSEWELANNGKWFPPLLVGIGLEQQIKHGEVLKEEFHDWEMDLIISS